jgi:hypothetical protein
MARKTATALAPVTNGAAPIINLSIPYVCHVTIEGTADLLFHAWNCESVAEKASSAKGSAAKKTDDLESYVYRDADGFLSLPGENLRQSVILAAKFRQDPRSPRKSAMDLFKAGVVNLSPFASLGIKDWDYEHRARVVIQRSAVTRVRPAIKAGWHATVSLLVTTPEYIPPRDLNETITRAGQLVGVCDFRPTYGRFFVQAFDVSQS